MDVILSPNVLDLRQKKLSSHARIQKVLPDGSNFEVILVVERIQIPQYAGQHQQLNDVSLACR